MSNILIVANQTLGGDALVTEIQKRTSDEAHFWVLVPATPIADLADVPPAGFASLSGGDDAAGLADARLAENRLATELDRLKQAGITADGEIGDPDPLRAMQDTMATRQFDEIILATLPQGISRWLRTDLVHRARRRFDIPLTHVESA
jgi:GABA permease